MTSSEGYGPNTIGELRRGAEGALEAAIGWSRDRWQGYLEALDDVAKISQRNSQERIADQDDVLNEVLADLDKMVQDNLLRGSINTFDVRDWLNGVKKRLGAVDAG